MAQRMMGRTLLAVIVAAGASVSVVRPATAEDHATVQFLDSSDLEVEAGAGERTQVAVEVVATVGQTAVLHLTGIDDLSIESDRVHLEVGSPQMVSVSIPPLDPGSHAGRLVVVAEDGTLASRAISITVAPTQETPAAIDHLGRPLPEEIVIGTDLWWPTPLVELYLPLIGVQDLVNQATVGVPTIPVDPELVGRAKSGGLIGSGGHVANVRQVGRKLQVTGISGAGTYSGKLEVAGAAEPVEVALSVEARDGWVWALLVLMLGLVLAGALDDFLTRRMPETRLKVLLGDLHAKAASLEQEQGSWFANSARNVLRADLPPDSRGVHTIIDLSGPEPSGWLAEETKRVVTTFADTGVPEERVKRFARDGADFIAVESIVRSYEELLRGVRKLASSYIGIREGLPAAAAEAFLRTGAASQALQAISGVPIESKDDLKSRGEDVTKGLALLAEFDVLRRQLADAERLATTSALKDLYDKAHSELLGRPAQTDLSTARTYIDALWAALGDARRSATESHEGLAASVTASTFTAPLEAQPDALRKRAAEDKRLFGWAAGALTVLSGLALLYATNATFGSVGDYLSVLVWGTTTREVLNIARRLPAFGG